jgi:hypothetical protein
MRCRRRGHRGAHPDLAIGDHLLRRHDPRGLVDLLQLLGRLERLRLRIEQVFPVDGDRRGHEPAALDAAQFLPSISAAVRASMILTPGLSIAPTTSLAVATQAGWGRALKRPAAGARRVHSLRCGSPPST